MLTWLQKRYRWRKLTKAATATIHEGRGYATNQWPWRTELRTTISIEVQNWLSQEIAKTGTPYGYSDYTVSLRLADVTAAGVQARWSEQLPHFTRDTVEQGLTAVCSRILTLDQTVSENTRLEVYLVSLGDILLRSYQKMGK